jgi:FkbM family methyltransferase
MRNPRKLAFVLAASDHGTMIVNRLDYRLIDQQRAIGVGYQILEQASFDQREIDLALSLLDLRRQHFGDGVVAIDCGANIGVHTVEWANRMSGWGRVIAIEAQERIFYALAGNVAINNCLNARALHAAVAAQDGTMRIPVPDYLKPGSFGSLELRPHQGVEPIGQPVDYSETAMTEIQTLTLDSLNLSRVDLIKIDVEGMELDASEGSPATIARCHPILIVESIKVDKSKLRAMLEQHGYRLFDVGINLLAIHEADKTLAHVKTS